MSPFIVFEGGEGCGKSTQARALRRKLARAGVASILTREPGGTSLGKEIRGSLKRHRDTLVSPMTELLLFAASRAQLVSEVILPGIEHNNVVICDRFLYSTIAYQGYGRGLNMRTIAAVNRLSAGDLKPDLVILLDAPPELGLSRRGHKDRDRFEKEELEFHRRVRLGYLAQARKEPGRWLVINAAISKSKIGRIVSQQVKRLLANQKDHAPV